VSKKPDKEQSLKARLGDAVKRIADGVMLVSVRVQPRSSKKGVEGVKDGTLRVRLTAPPAEGEANAQLVGVLSKELGIRKSAIMIVKGHSSRDKLVELDLA
jgi:uncharacterized protein (TIGR00251 family)